MAEIGFFCVLISSVLPQNKSHECLTSAFILHDISCGRTSAKKLSSSKARQSGGTDLLLCQNCKSRSFGTGCTDVRASVLITYVLHTDTDMRRLTTRIRYEKCVVRRRFRRCANFKECTYTNLDSTV